MFYTLLQLCTTYKQSRAAGEIKQKLERSVRWKHSWTDRRQKKGGKKKRERKKGKKRGKKREIRTKGSSASVKEIRKGNKNVKKEERKIYINRSRSKEQIKCCNPHKFTGWEINGTINSDGLGYLLWGMHQIRFCKSHYKLQAWCKSKGLLNYYLKTISRNKMSTLKKMSSVIKMQWPKINHSAAFLSLAGLFGLCMFNLITVLKTASAFYLVHLYWIFGLISLSV